MITRIGNNTRPQCHQSLTNGVACLSRLGRLLPEAGMAWHSPQICNLQPREAVSKMYEVPPCRLQGRFGLFFQKTRRSQFPLSKMYRYEQPMGTALQYEARRAESSIISELTWGVGILQIGAEELRVTPGLAKLRYSSVVQSCLDLSEASLGSSVLQTPEKHLDTLGRLKADINLPLNSHLPFLDC